MLRRFQSYLVLTGQIWCARGNRGRRLAALTRSAFWLLNKKFQRRAWTLKIFDCVRFRCHPESLVALHVIQRSEWYDEEVSRFISDYLKPGDTFLDIGANVGLYTLPGSEWVGPKGRVIAVEPSPTNRKRLEENLALNGTPSNVTIHACALADQPGTLRFDDADLQAHALSNRVEVLGKIIEVPAKTFDELDPHCDIPLAKIDVEGFELYVLRGASKALHEGRLPVILFEMNNAIEDYGLRPQELFDFLRSHGYQIGKFQPAERTLFLSDSPNGELTAFTARGRQLIESRMPDVKFSAAAP